jgi:hypothetical protein
VGLEETQAGSDEPENFCYFVGAEQFTDVFVCLLQLDMLML